MLKAPLVTLDTRSTDRNEGRGTLWWHHEVPLRRVPCAYEVKAQTTSKEQDNSQTHHAWPGENGLESVLRVIFFHPSAANFPRIFF